MNTNLIVTVISFLLMGLIVKPNATICNTLASNKADTLKKFDIKVGRVVECSAPCCLEETLKEIQNLKSYVLARKSGDYWIVEKKAQNIKKMLDKYPIKQLSIGSGNISINNKSIPQKYIVLLNIYDN